MADNVAITAGSGTTIAADDIAGVLVQRVKTTWGPDGTMNDVDVATGKPMPVQLRSSTGTDLIGTAGSASAAVVTVQGIASGTAQPASQSGTWTVQPGNTANTTAWKVDGSAVTQPISAASLPLPSAAATSTKQSDGSQKSQVVDGSGNVIGATSNALDVNVKSGGATSGTAGTASSDVISVQGIASMTPLLATAAGDVAHDGADSGNPQKIGARARSSEIAAVSNNDRSDLITDLVGKLITLPYANPENFVSGAITSAMTGTTSTSLLAAPASGLRNYITQITVSNSHATVGTDIIIQDGSGGTTLYTIPAAAVYGGAVLTFPVPLRQPTTATAIYCANVTTGASTKVSASGYKGA